MITNINSPKDTVTYKLLIKLLTLQIIIFIILIQIKYPNDPTNHLKNLTRINKNNTIFQIQSKSKNKDPQN